MTSRQARPSYARRIQWLAFGVVVLVLAYVAGWHYLADRIGREVDAALAGLDRDGISAECADREVRGFPFRMGLFCSRLTASDDRDAFSVEAEGLRSAAQVYDPLRIVGEMDRLAATIALPDGGAAQAFAASDLRFSGRIAEPLPQRASVEAKNVTLEPAGQKAVAASSGSAGTLQAHMRRRGGDLDLAASADTVSLRLEGIPQPLALPRIDVDLTLADGVARVASRARGLRGLAGTLRGLNFATGPDSGFSALGPISVRDDGLIDADLTLSVRNPAAVSAFLVQIFPDERDRIESLFRGLAILGDSPSLPLKVTGGMASIGFVPLGRIPPVEE